MSYTYLCRTDVVQCGCGATLRYADAPAALTLGGAAVIRESDVLAASVVGCRERKPCTRVAAIESGLHDELLVGGERVAGSDLSVRADGIGRLAPVMPGRLAEHGTATHSLVALLVDALGRPVRDTVIGLRMPGRSRQEVTVDHAGRIEVPADRHGAVARVETGAQAAPGPDYELAAGVDLPPQLLATLEAIAGRFRADPRSQGAKVVVTSGYRDAQGQAAAMAKKLETSETEFYEVYGRGERIREIVDAWSSGGTVRVAETIRKQIRDGFCVSRHLTGRALDLRIRGFKPEARDALLDAARPEVRSLRVEGSPPHLHIEVN